MSSQSCTEDPSEKETSLVITIHAFMLLVGSEKGHPVCKSPASTTLKIALFVDAAKPDVTLGKLTI